MEQTTKQPIALPKPFLGPVFRHIDPEIATGFNYHKNEIALHGVTSHMAIDFDTRRGVEIINPCDGWFVATYGEVALLNEDGTAKTLSVAKAKRENPRGASIHPPESSTKAQIFFGSYVVQGWHGNGRYTQYAHIDWCNPVIPYYQPVEQENGDLKHSPILRATVDTYKEPNKAVFLKAGEVLATVGMTGCGWGERCYSYASFDSSGRPDFTSAKYPHYTNPHLHFMVFGKRLPRSRNASVIWDPFAVYKEAGSDYPRHKSEWDKLPNSLWLSQS